MSEQLSQPKRVVVTLIMEQTENGSYAISDTLLDGTPKQIAVALVTAGELNGYLKRLPADLPALLQMQNGVAQMHTEVNNAVTIALWRALGEEQSETDVEENAIVTGD